MTTALLYRDDAYARECAARVLAAGPEGVLLDRTVFYAQAGGQPGDAGALRWEGGAMAVAKAVKGAGRARCCTCPPRARRCRRSAPR